MRFDETGVAGAFVIHPERRSDERGFFERLWCRDTFARHGLSADFVQCNHSGSRRRGTLRGLHYQTPPHEEAKLVQCVRGEVFDVLVDVRPGSSTFGRWVGTTLTAASGAAVYVPAGCAHGYLTLSDESAVVYPVTAAYAPAFERGIRWNDPAFGIAWPDVGPLTLSDKDRAWPDFT
jgi:dTDP-4-dehydrorhamnose 3,5-epimerase